MKRLDARRRPLPGGRDDVVWVRQPRIDIFKFSCHFTTIFSQNLLGCSLVTDKLLILRSRQKTSASGSDIVTSETSLTLVQKTPITLIMSFDIENYLKSNV